MRKLTITVALCSAVLLGGVTAEAQSQESSSQAPPPTAPPAASQTPPVAPPAPKLKGAAAMQPVDPNAGKTIEEIIARVNNEVITLSEYEKARDGAADDAKQECQGRCTPEQLQAAIEDGRKNTLRNLIDKSLLVQRAKDMGISVKPEVIKQLDQIRQQNKLGSI